MIGTLSFTISRSSGRTLVAVAGEIDLATAPELDAVLQDFGHHSVTVDLNDVTFIDSFGLATLMRAHDRIAHAGGRLCVRGRRPNVRRTFQVAGLAERFDVDPLPI